MACSAHVQKLLNSDMNKSSCLLGLGILPVVARAPQPRSPQIMARPTPGVLHPLRRAQRVDAEDLVELSGVKGHDSLGDAHLPAQDADVVAEHVEAAVLQDTRSTARSTSSYMETSHATKETLLGRPSEAASASPGGVVDVRDHHLGIVLDEEPDDGLPMSRAPPVTRHDGLLDGIRTSDQNKRKRTQHGRTSSYKLSKKSIYVFHLKGPAPGSAAAPPGGVQ